MRIGSALIENNTTTFTFEQMLEFVAGIYEEDLDEIIAQSFDKLDITD